MKVFPSFFLRDTGLTGSNSFWLTWLIRSLLAEIHDDLCGALVESVEVVPVLVVQAAVRELINATKAVHQFPGNKRKEQKEEGIKNRLKIMRDS